MRKTVYMFAASVTAGLLIAAGPASADLLDVNIFNNTVYTQDSTSAPTTPVLYFFNITAEAQNAGDFDSASVSYPGPGSPQSLPASGTSFGTAPAYGSEADLHAAYPFGDYAISAHNSVTNDTQGGVIHYTGDHFTTVIPTLSAATFTGLQGLDPATALQIAFNSFTPDAASSEAFGFFTISDASGVIFSQGFLDPSTTNFELPANLLDPNTVYSFELDFSDRINGSDDASGLPTIMGFDMRTDGQFTTGDAVAPAPEPATLALFGAALLGLRRRRKQA
jgi:hypothetical protein